MSEVPLYHACTGAAREDVMIIQVLLIFSRTLSVLGAVATNLSWPF